MLASTSMTRPAGSIRTNLQELRILLPNQPEYVYRYGELVASDLAETVNEGFYLSLIAGISRATTNRSEMDHIGRLMPIIVVKVCDIEFADRINLFAEGLGRAVKKMVPENTVVH